MATQTQTPKATTSKRTAQKPAAKEAPKSRRVFAPGQCHHRAVDGSPDCRKKIVAKRANLCPEHEAEWQKAARLRYMARRAAQPAAAAKTSPDVEEQLAASVAAFATPELAAKAKAKRAAQRSPRSAK